MFAPHPLSSALLCWTTLTDFVFFILKWEMLFLLINNFDLFDMEAPVCLVFTKHIIQILNFMYLMVLFLMKIRLCWQIVFQFEFFPPFAWEYDEKIWYGLHHIHLEFFSGNDVFNYVPEYCDCSMACAWWAFLVHKHNQLDILVCSSSPEVLQVDVGYLLEHLVLEHLVHDCYHCHHMIFFFCWMLIAWALDKRIDQEWVGCIFDVGFNIQCVLFSWCKGEGGTSQVIQIIQKSNNMFIDMSHVVHIIQKLNIMSFFYSLHVDIFGKHLSLLVM